MGSSRDGAQVGGPDPTGGAHFIWASEVPLLSQTARAKGGTLLVFTQPPKGETQPSGTVWRFYSQLRIRLERNKRGLQAEVKKSAFSMAHGKSKTIQK